ncbi:MAG: 1-acyl-sn-glycerol-3-phosphate acyltransferase [Bacteroidales bacterium]|nr:1-acyl-sn-glycerol-3-phosphate acyltransferase [Bacteroidales bacterium]
MKELWDNDLLYKFLRFNVDFCTRHSYRKIVTEGSLPTDGGAVIYAPNHTNTLMDALLVLQERKEGTAFGARADVFRKPKIANFLRRLKIVPLARRDRDRPDELARNKPVMEYIDRILEHDLPFCIFSEGRHRTMHSLLPIRRGIAHIAFVSAAQRPTRIVPIGLDYSDWFHYRSCVRIKIGEPLDVNAFLKEHEGCSDGERDAALQQELYKRISSLIFFIPDDEHYEERLAEAMAAKPKRNKFLRVLQAVLSFPLFLACAVLALPMWAIAEYICHKKIKDPAFRNTARFAVKLVGTPIFFILWAVALFLLLTWWLAAILLLLFLISYSVFYDWLNLVAGR